MSADFPGTASKAAHGTSAGFQMHKRLGTPACDQCREANRVEHAKYLRKNYDPVDRHERYLASKERSTGL